MRTGGRMGGSRFNYNNKRSRRRYMPPFFIPLSRGSKMNVSTNRGFRGRSFSTSMQMISRGYPTAKISMDAGGGSTTSYYKSRQKFHPDARVIKRASNAQLFMINASKRIDNVAYGQQAVETFDSASLSNLATMLEDIPTIAGTATLTKSAILHDIHFEYTFSNMSEATAFLDLYEIVPRTLLPLTVTPDVLFTNGILDQDTGATTSAGYKILGVKPTASLAFTSMYKIMKHYRVELAQGRSHVHFSKHHLGFKYNYELINALGASYFHPRSSRFLMCIVQGSPCNKTGNKEVVTTTPAAVDAVVRAKYTWYYNVPATKNTRYSNFLGTITGDDTGSIMDIGSGESEVVNVTN